MARHGSLSDCVPTPIPIEISDVVTMPIALQVLNLNEAMQRLLEDLRELDGALIAHARRRNKVLGHGCKQASRAFHEVRCNLNDVLGGEPARAE
jgi:hypothetical protein